MTKSRAGICVQGIVSWTQTPVLQKKDNNNKKYIIPMNLAFEEDFKFAAETRLNIGCPSSQNIITLGAGVSLRRFKCL